MHNMYNLFSRKKTACVATLYTHVLSFVLLMLSLATAFVPISPLTIQPNHHVAPLFRDRSAYRLPQTIRTNECRDNLYTIFSDSIKNKKAPSRKLTPTFIQSFFGNVRKSIASNRIVFRLLVTSAMIVFSQVTIQPANAVVLGGKEMDAIELAYLCFLCILFLYYSYFMVTPTFLPKRFISVCKLIVVFDVPNRNDSDCILSSLDRMAETVAVAAMDTQQGTQQLTSQVAVELLRRASSIQSAYGEANYYADDDSNAQRTFNEWSIEASSNGGVTKFRTFDLSLSKFTYCNRGGKTVLVDTDPYSSAKNTRATKAIVKLVLSLKGTNIKKRQPRSIRSISDVESMLRHIASEVMMDGNDITGVAFFWAPDDRNEVLTLDDVMAQYPELIVL
jgi:Protein of unknown function (DUF1517)